MQCVLTGLDRYVGSSSGISPRFRTGLCLYREVFRGVNREEHAGNSGHATLVHRGDVVPQIVVIRTIDLPVDLVSPCTVQRAKTAAGISGEAGR